MRTSSDIKFLKSRFSPPRSHDCITPAERAAVLDLFYSGDVVQKVTGPRTVKVYPHQIPTIMEKIRKLHPKIEVRNAHVFDVDKPHVLHIDDDETTPNNIFKAFTIPLTSDPLTEGPKLVFFKQHYFGGPVKFFKGRKDAPVHYNKPLSDYSEVHGLTEGLGPYLDPDLTHIKKQWLEGLSIDRKLDWTFGHMLEFDALQIHSASDFRNFGIKRKTGLSIFTTLNP